MATTLKEFIIAFRIKYLRDPSNEEKRAADEAITQYRRAQREINATQRETRAAAKARYAEEQQEIAQNFKNSAALAALHRQREATAQKNQAAADRIGAALQRQSVAAERQEAARIRRDRTAADKAVASLQRQSEAKEEKESKRLHKVELQQIREGRQARDVAAHGSLVSIARIGSALRGFVGGFLVVQAIREISEAVQESAAGFERRRRVSEKVNAPGADIAAAESAYEKKTGRPGPELSEQLLAFKRKTQPGTPGAAFARALGVTEQKNDLIRMRQADEGLIRKRIRDGYFAAQKFGEQIDRTPEQAEETVSPEFKAAETRAKQLADIHLPDPKKAQDAVQAATDQFSEIGAQQKAILDNVTGALADGVNPALREFNQVLQNNAPAIRTVTGWVGELTSALGAFLKQTIHGADVLGRLAGESRSTVAKASPGILGALGGVEAPQALGPPAAAAAPPAALPAVDPDRFKREQLFDPLGQYLRGLQPKKLEESSAVQGAAAGQIAKAAATEERAAQTFAKAVDQDVKQREKAESQSLWQRAMGAAGGAWTGLRNAFGGGGPGDTGFIGTPSLGGGPGGTEPGMGAGPRGGSVGAANRRYGAGGHTPGGAPATGKLGERQAEAMRYTMDQLRKEGVPEANLRQAAAHLVGQATMESGLDPSKTHDIDKRTGQPTGYGIYGARDPEPGKGRKTNMLNWLKANNYAPNSLEGQARYMAHEAMSGRYPQTRRALMEGQGPEVTNAITKEFENPTIVNERASAVRQAFGAAGGAEVPGGASPGGGAATPGAPTNSRLSVNPQTYGLEGADPRLQEIVHAASSHLPPGYTAEIVAAGRQAGASGFHPRGQALDIRIKDPQGQPIQHFGEDTTGLYTRLARAAYGEQLARYPELKGQFAWGGAFGTSKSNPNQKDLMHFDIGGERGRFTENRLSNLGVLPGAQFGGRPVARDPDRMVRDIPASLQDLPGFGRNAEAIRANVGIVSPETRPGGAAAAAPLSSGDTSNDNSRSVTQHNNFKTTIHSSDPQTAASLYKRANEQHAGTALGNIRPVLR